MKKASNFEMPQKVGHYLGHIYEYKKTAKVI